MGTDYLETLVTSGSLWGLFGSAFISATVAPGGSEAVLAYLVAQNIYPSALLLTVATTGNTLGALTTLMLGYWAGVRLPPDLPDDNARHRAVIMIQRWGLPVLLLSWLPVVGDGFCFAAGWLRMPFGWSMLLIAVGKLARYAAIVYAFASH